MKAVILAGGLGTRMGSVSKDIPKPMLKIAGKPVLEHQIEVLKREGIAEIIFVVGYLGEKIEEYFKDGTDFGVSISYFYETEPLGTAGALFELDLKEDFLLCNGDLIFNFDLKKMVAFHREKKALATLFTHPNSHPYDSTLICTDEENAVTAFLKMQEENPGVRNLCNAGIEIISPGLLKMYDIKGKADLDREIISPAVKTGRIYSYRSFEYVKDMGTPERFLTVEKDLLDGTVGAKHRSKPQRAVFLDRDGTVNVHKGYITEPGQIELLPKAAEAIAGLNSRGYLVIIVTNQPVIARGECSEEKLTEIHNRLESLLGQKGAFVDGIYYCPHHPDRGFENEVPELKTVCDCRKPAPGLLLRAQKDFNIDMARSFMVGDSVRDVEAGRNAGCRTVLLTAGCEEKNADGVLQYGSLYAFFEDMVK